MNEILEPIDETTITEEAFEAGDAVDTEEANGIDQYTDLHDGDDEGDDDFDADRYDSAAGWQPPDPYAEIKAKLRKEAEDTHPGVNPFIIFGGTDIYPIGPEPSTTPLLGDLWRQGEIAIMFADTGIGKSLFAVQIAESLARGLPVEPFEMGLGPQQVIYIDFEMTGKQFAARYTCPDHIAENGGPAADVGPAAHLIDINAVPPGPPPGSYPFSPNFRRAYLDWYYFRPKVFKTRGDHMGWAVRDMIDRDGANILIVDNVSFLNTANTSSSAALRLMRALKNIRDQYKVSILVLAHTPRRRPGSPLTINDLQGSHMLANFSDNMFAIGRSGTEPEVRYLKHIKGRSSRFDFQPEKVAAFRLTRSAGPAAMQISDAGLPKRAFLGFHHIGSMPEREMLVRQRQEAETERRRNIAAARALRDEGFSLGQIAAELGIGKSTVKRYCRPEGNTADHDPSGHMRADRATPDHAFTSAAARHDTKDISGSERSCGLCSRETQAAISEGSAVGNAE